MATDTHDSIQFLARSPERAKLLCQLCGQPARPSTIADSMALSRRSVQRNLSALCDRGWVEKKNGQYQVTTTGTVVANAHETYREQLSTIEEFETVLTDLPDTDHVPPLATLDTATVVTPSDGQPHAPLQQYFDTVRAFDTDRVRMLAPVLSRPLHDAHARLAFDGVHTELVLPSPLCQQARQSNPAEFDALVAFAPLTIYRYQKPVDIGITVGDTEAVLCTYDDQDHLTACITASEPAMIEWATQLYDHYRARATEIERPGQIAASTTDAGVMDSR